MTTGVEQRVAVSGLTREEDSNPDLGESVAPQFGLCKNLRCKKVLDGTPGVLKGRQEYCCAYSRVDVCRRKRQSNPEQIAKLKRKRRRDAKYASTAERQRAYHKRHRPSPLPEAMNDYLWVWARRAGQVSGLALRQSGPVPSHWS
jgi:hypothetical protein